MAQHTALFVGQHVLVKPAYHLSQGESCRAWTHQDYTAGRVAQVSDDGKSAVVEYFEFRTPPCSCGPRIQSKNTHFLGEMVTGG